MTPQEYHKFLELFRKKAFEKIKEKNINQISLAVEINVLQGTISNFFRGAGISLPTALSLAVYLGISLESLARKAKGPTDVPHIQRGYPKAVKKVKCVSTD